jgi:hypothetical protein
MWKDRILWGPMEPLIGMGIGYREDKDRDDADEVEGVED